MPSSPVRSLRPFHHSAAKLVSWRSPPAQCGRVDRTVHILGDVDAVIGLESQVAGISRAVGVQSRSGAESSGRGRSGGVCGRRRGGVVGVVADLFVVGGRRLDRGGARGSAVADGQRGRRDGGGDGLRRGNGCDGRRAARGGVGQLRHDGVELSGSEVAGFAEELEFLEKVSLGGVARAEV